MGWVILFLRKRIETFAKGNSKNLSLGGFVLTLTVTTLSALAGWLIEQFYISNNTINIQFLSTLFLVLALASSLALKSLKESTLQIINALNEDSNDLDIDLAGLN